MRGSIHARQDHDRELDDLPPLLSEAEIRAQLRQMASWHRPHTMRGRPLPWWVANAVHCLREQHTQSIARERAWNKDHANA